MKLKFLFLFFILELCNLLFSQSSFAQNRVTHVVDEAWVKLSALIGRKSSQNMHNHISLFFIQKSNNAMIMPAENNTHSNCYKIILTDLSSNIIYFSDAPKRLTGTISAAKFLSSWEHGFGLTGAGPNGVIHGVSANKDVGDVVMLSHPVYDHEHQKITYTACSLRPYRSLNDHEILNDVLIFIDPFGPWPP